jgi:hypothetical protein
MLPTPTGLLAWLKRLLSPPAPVALANFLPAPGNTQQGAWWKFSPRCLQHMLGVLGFDVRKTIHSQPVCLLDKDSGTKECVTLVADRVAGQACLPKPIRPMSAA